MSILLGFLWLATSLFVLVKAADYFTEYSEKLGKALNIPNFIIGITIIALGTSLPELASSAAAIAKGASEIVAANVIGSNVANVLDLQITTIEAIVLLLGYFVYIAHTIFEYKPENKTKQEKKKISWKIPIFIIASCVFIYLGAEQTIDSLIYLSTLLGISESVISLTVVALGTSLPEVLVSVSAARRGSYDIALGNIIGSNMFNILLIPGILALFSTLSVSPETISTGVIFLVISTLLFIVSLYDNRIKKGEGLMFLVLYLFFIYSLYI